MTHQDIKQSKAAGNSDWEILSQVIESGYEYPEAVYRTAAALRLDAAERQCMEHDYDQCC